MSNIFSDVISTISNAFSDINPNTLSGVIDIVVIKQPDGSLTSSPFHVRFGKLHLLAPKEKLVHIKVNGKDIDIGMKLGRTGEAFFVKECEDETVADEWLTSPIPSPRYGSPISEISLGDPAINEVKVDEDVMLSPPRSEYVWEWGDIPVKENSTSIPITTFSRPKSTPISVRPTTRKSWMSSIMFWKREIPKEPLPRFRSRSVPPVRKLKPEFKCVYDDLFVGVIDSAPLDIPHSPYHVIDNLDNIEISTSGITTGSDANERFDANKLSFDSVCRDPSIFFSKNLVVKWNSRLFSYQEAVPMIMSLVVFKQSICKISDDVSTYKPKSLSFLDWFRNSRDLPNKSQNLPRITRFRSKSPKKDIIRSPPPRQASPPQLQSPPPSVQPKYRKMFRPTSDQLKSMNLQMDRNTITFSVYSQFQGKQTMTASIFLWNHDDKIVVSDIDGTITKSDGLGNILPLVGLDWSHSGVVSLFTSIRNNGYRILYLTARAIGQSQFTRTYIDSVRQRKVPLPDGPIFLSPESLLRSFKREVIDRRPQDFKIVALRDFVNLFPDGYSPFYAGFGNRETDHVAYAAVGFPEHRIFIINNAGDISNVCNNKFHKSYPLLHQLVDSVFPDVASIKSNHEFNQVSFWKSSYLQDIDLDDDSD